MIKPALIVVDMENEWTERMSPYFLGDITVLIARINKLIDYSRKEGHKIIFITHIEKKGTMFSEKTKKVKIIKEVHKVKGDLLIKKYKISPFYKTRLHKALAGITDITICGVLTNLCVRATAEDAYDRDFKVTIVSDCCKTFDPAVHEFTLKDLKEMRDEIEITDLKRVLES